MNAKRFGKGSYLSYVTTFFFYYFCMSVYSSVLSVYLTGIGKTASEMSFIVSGANLFSLITVPLTGFLNDVVRRPKVISCTAILLAGVLSIVFAFSRAVFILFLLNGLIMTAINCVMPVTEKLAASCPYRYGAIRIWGTFGYAVAAQTATLILANISSVWLFLSIFAASIIAVVGFIRTADPEDGQREQDTRDAAPERRKGLKKIILNPVFLLFIAIAFVFNGTSSVNMTYAPLLLQELGISVSAVGTIIFFSTLMEIPLIFFSHKFMDRFNVKTFLLTAFILMLTQLLIYSSVKNAAVIVIAMVLLRAITTTLFMMVVLKAVRNIISPLYTTTGLSIVNSVNSLGAIIMQNTAGMIVDSRGISFLYLVLTVLVGIGLVLTIFIKVENKEKVFR